MTIVRTAQILKSKVRLPALHSLCRSKRHRCSVSSEREQPELQANATNFAGDSR